MPRYRGNPDAVAQRLITARHYVLEGNRGDVQPDADLHNTYSSRHDWADDTTWQLGPTDGVNDETKACHPCCIGDFPRLHGSEMITRPGTRAAYALLTKLDERAGVRESRA